MKFQELIEQNKEALIRDLQGAVRCPSVEAIGDGSGYPFGKGVQDCLEYTLGVCEKLGFKTTNLDNYVGWCEYGEGEEMVAVLGHLDVVPEGDGWSIPPYEGRVEGGRIYGRGTMDDKGPIYAALYGLKAIKDSGLPMKRRVRIIFGLNEETGSADMKYYAEHCGQYPVVGFTPDAEYPVINGEKGLIIESYGCKLQQKADAAIVLKKLEGGTAVNIVPAFAKAELACSPKLAAEIAAKQAEGISCSLTDGGVIVEAEGVSAHGAMPEEGINAIGRLMVFMNTLPLEGQLAKAVQLLAEKIGMETDGKSLGIALWDEVSQGLTNNMGTIAGNEEELTVGLNYRYPVTKSFDQCGPKVKAEFEAAGFTQLDSRHDHQLYVAPESELVQKLMSVYTQYSGRNDAPKSIGGGTYAKSMPNVVAFGPIFPGDEVREHKPDEFMELSRLVDNAIIYANSIYALAND